ncbi:MAG TPA: methylmalonyl Co-A mutase-associated GTPase MeaB [bacterium]|nr:methylmalonyl Co-A mutase-associated GTPase MeaB [bacterium]
MAHRNDLATAVADGDRGALARAITLVESQRPADKAAAEQLLTTLLPRTGGALRVGITGAPGVGKSTLIEALGMQLCDAGRRVAVLAVDPSSTVSGGSILGDKTRMDQLSRRPEAFIRPSPGGGTLGGVASRTQEAMLLCEAAGFDVVLVETIGTGQSEVAVHDMVDFFLLLLSPAAGDELQGIKRGVMELCDGVLVNKADGDLIAAANATAQQCTLAMRVLHAGEANPPSVRTASATTGEGLSELWREIESTLARSRADGRFTQRRQQQAVRWLERSVREGLQALFEADGQIRTALASAKAKVAAGELVATAAANDLLRQWRNRCSAG